MSSNWQFLKTFFRDPRVASVTPTSPAAVARICQPLDFSRPLAIIELGPGNGAFTRYLLSRMTADSRLFAVELNPQFSTVLKAIGDSRITVANDSAERLTEIVTRGNFPPADFVISGIPFSFFSGVRQQEIMRQVKSSLKPGGVFIVYQISPQVSVHLRTVFGHVQQFRFWRNVPPLMVFYASR